MDYLSSKESVEFDIEIDVTNIQSYMFEPLVSTGDEEEEDQIDVDAHRIGDTKW